VRLTGRESEEASVMHFYVYELADPRSGAVFYVGKGSRDRIDHHEGEARRGVHSRKCELIRELQAAGLTPEKRKVAYFMDEQDAYDFETGRIVEIGLANLTNVMPGGQRAWIERQAVVAERERARRAVRDKAKREATRAYLRKWLAMVDSWPNGSTFPNLKNGDELAAQHVAYVRKMLAEHP
jgi:hypothetical protein